MTKTKVVICPYCGETQPNTECCRACRGMFDTLSRQATQNEMGPWYLRDPGRPFQPGCSYETLVRLIERGQVNKYTMIRGPTTRQFWTVAKHAPGVAHLLGFCHACDHDVDPGIHGCPACGVPFGAYLDRNHLGLPEVEPLPGEAPSDQHREGRAHLDGITAYGPHAPGVGRSPGGGGLSSFADDAELLGSGAVATAAEPAWSTVNRVSRPTAVSAITYMASQEADEVEEQANTRAGLRAMQRQVVRQQKTIRILVGLVVIVALLSVIVGLLAARSGDGRDLGDEIGEPVTASTAIAPGSRDTAPTPPPERGEPLAPDADAVVVDAPERPTPPAPPLASPLAPPPAHPPATTEAAADYARALELAGQAADPDRAVDERLADAEETRSILQSIAARVPEADWPEDLTDHLTSIEDTIERLKLAEFFP